MKFRSSSESQIIKESACLQEILRRFIFQSVPFVPVVIAVIAIAIGRPVMAQSASSAGDADIGKKLFVKDGCFECHGRMGQGGGLNGPRIAPDPIPVEALLIFVRHPSGEMPPYSAKVLPERDVRDISAYLTSIPQPPSVDSIPILKH